MAVAFKRGDFGKPQATHSEVPPGVPMMQRLKDGITYTYYETVGGWIVRIHTANPEAVAAVHEFLSYEVRKHKTGDPIAPPGSAAAATQGHQQAATHHPVGARPITLASTSTTPPSGSRRSTTRRAMPGRCLTASSRRCS